MSTTHDIACKDHKEKLWIGQSSHASEFHLYREAKCLDRLDKFLIRHSYCNLIFSHDVEEMVEYPGYYRDFEDMLEKGEVKEGRYS